MALGQWSKVIPLYNVKQCLKEHTFQIPGSCRGEFCNLWSYLLSSRSPSSQWSWESNPGTSRHEANTLATELQPQLSFFFSFSDRVLQNCLRWFWTQQPTQTLNFQSSCLSFSSSWDYMTTPQVPGLTSFLTVIAIIETTTINTIGITVYLGYYFCGTPK